MQQDFERTHSQFEKTQIYYGAIGVGLTTNDLTFYPWIKPRNISFIYVTVIGGGAGGGGGGASAAATAAGGGEGGGGGGTACVLIPAFMVPDVLYLAPGYGGKGGTGQVQGGAAATAGENAVSSYITTRAKQLSGPYVLATSGTIFATGGQAASGATAGSAAGTGETIATIASASMMSGMGLFSFIAGLSGSNGGSGAAGTNLSPLTTTVSRFCTGGAGGGGTNAGTTTFAGGNIQGVGWLPATPGGTAGGGRGNDGNNYFGQRGSIPVTYWMGGGGSGGGSNTSAGTGGAGGHGAPGSGGGGGGGTNGTSSVGGAGGDGGPGIIIISCM